MIDLQGQTAIVTGASRGLGLAIAAKLREQGAAVHLLATQMERLEKAKKLLEEKSGAQLWTWACDVSNTESFNQTLNDILKQSSKIEILVNNAGVTRDNLLLRMKDEDFDHVIATNLRSVYLGSKAIIKPMIKQRYGRIINISSIVGVRGQAGQANYAASKAGIIGFTKSLAREIASRNITCNAIAPGFIQSDMTESLNEEQKKSILADIPLGRMGLAEEVAFLTTFLASREAAYITGQVLSIDGGMGI